MIELRVLGGVDLRSSGAEDPSVLLGQPKLLALLVFLAAAPGPGLVRRDSLVALFWPELDASRARASLRSALHELRAALGADVVS